MSHIVFSCYHQLSGARTNLSKIVRWALLAPAMAISMVGCTALTQPIDGIPARRLPPQFFAPPKNNLVPIDIARLAQEPPRQYLLDAGDILGVYIEGVLPFTPPDQPPQLPPVHFPEADSTLPPSLGYPIAIQEDGTIALPLVRPVNVRGMTVEQVREVIRRAYIDAKVFSEDQDKARVLTPIVSLLKERQYSIIVVRQDAGAGSGGTAGRAGGGGTTVGTDFSSKGNIVKLPAYQNDVLHALMETGGLPGVNAKNEVKILRASNNDFRARDEFIRQFYASTAACNPCLCPPPLPDDPSIVRIPLRLPPGVTPTFNPQDIILEEGDIVYIESRDTEIFYTGGLLPGGQWQIPRDYDLDVLGAMAIAGTGVQGGGQQGGQMMGGLGGLTRNVPPGRLYILRQTPCNGQVAIEVDLAKAINSPRDRPLVQPGDILILQFKPEEEILNFSIAAFFTFGIQELFRN